MVTEGHALAPFILPLSHNASQTSFNDLHWNIGCLFITNFVYCIQIAGIVKNASVA